MYEEFCQFILTLLHYSDRLRSFYIVMCVINALTCCLATVLNFLVIIIIKQRKSLHTPSYVMISALAFSDLAVGCVAQPLYIAFRVADITGSSIYCKVGFAFDFMGNWFGGMSFLVIASISVDRFLALYLREKYRVIVTQNRAIVVAVTTGIVGMLYALTGMLDRKAYYVAGSILGPLALVITSLNYINIYRMIRQHHKRSMRLSAHHSTKKDGSVRNEMDMKRYKHTLKTLFYVFIVFLLCYLPYIAIAVVLKAARRNDAVQMSVHITPTIVFINSSLNPLLYCWRIPEIRKSVKQILCRDKQSSLQTTSAGPSSDGVRSGTNITLSSVSSNKNDETENVQPTVMVHSRPAQQMQTLTDTRLRQES